MLFGLTRAFFHPRLVSAARYSKTAGWACATVAVLVPLVDWIVNGYPNMEDFGLQRFIGDTNANPEPSALTILLYVILPTPVLALPMWLSGKFVAGQYARWAGGTDDVGEPPTAAENPSEN